MFCFYKHHPNVCVRSRVCIYVYVLNIQILLSVYMHMYTYIQVGRQANCQPPISYPLFLFTEITIFFIPEWSTIPLWRYMLSCVAAAFLNSDPCKNKNKTTQWNKKPYKKGKENCWKGVYVCMCGALYVDPLCGMTGHPERGHLPFVASFMEARPNSTLLHTCFQAARTNCPVNTTLILPFIHVKPRYMNLKSCHLPRPSLSAPHTLPNKKKRHLKNCKRLLTSRVQRQYTLNRCSLLELCGRVYFQHSKQCHAEKG